MFNQKGLQCWVTTENGVTLAEHTLRLEVDGVDASIMLLQDESIVIHCNFCASADFPTPTWFIVHRTQGQWTSSSTVDCSFGGPGLHYFTIYAGTIGPERVTPKPHQPQLKDFGGDVRVTFFTKDNNPVSDLEARPYATFNFMFGTVGAEASGKTPDGPRSSEMLLAPLENILKRKREESQLDGQKEDEPVRKSPKQATPEKEKPPRPIVSEVKASSPLPPNPDLATADPTHDLPQVARMPVNEEERMLRVFLQRRVAKSNTTRTFCQPIS